MIQVFYRHYNTSGRENWRPSWFDYERCFNNFVKTLMGYDNVNVTIIYDGEDESNFIFNYGFKVVKINAGSDLNSFNQTLDYIQSLNLDNDDIVYLLENDYLHINEWIPKVVDFFENYKEVYLTLYDHADKYMYGYDDLRSKIILGKSHHFRSTPSTCGSFIVRNEVLIDDLKYHKLLPNFLYDITNVPVDHGKFLILNTLKNREIYGAIPGLSTHCLNNLLSPNIDWEIISNKI